MKNLSARLLAFLLILSMPVSILKAQEQGDDLFELSLDELMDIEIVSASKKAENVFDTPVSSYSISHEEIVAAGVTSIPEALRLCPGLVVRETTNGNYDIHIRGFDNPARYTTSYQQMNMLTLVMIDNRPVFNYNLGGTYWEALPIDLIDVERIEVVKGPTSPLFGPNAVTGVINIITKKVKKEGLYASGNAQLDNLGSNIGNLALGQKISDKLSYVVSANYQRRERHDDLYYFYGDDAFAENLSSISNADVAYPDPSLSLKKVGVNGFFNYQASDEAEVNLSLGYQDAQSQRPYLPETAALSFNANQSKYVNLNAYYHGINAKISHNNGYDNLRLGNFTTDGTTITTEYDFNITDIVVDYQWTINSKLSVRPGFNYQSATYDDTEYNQNSPSGGFLNAKKSLNSTAGSVRIDYLPLKDWRLVGAVRSDKFNVPDELYTSYQFATTYKIYEKYLFRASHAKSNSGAFMANTSLNVNLETDLAFAGPGSGPFVTARNLGNPNINLTHITSTEFGFRGQLADHIQIDVELFHQKLENTSLMMRSSETYQPTGLPAPYPPYVPSEFVDSYQNLPLRAIQNGLTISANYVASAKVQLKPFITFQQTKLEDLPLAFNTLPLDPETNPYNLTTTTEEDHKSTPSVYGGGYINVAPTTKFNVNLSTYFYGQQTLYYSSDRNPNRNSTVGDIDGKMLLNAKVSYLLVDKLKIYLSGRNILNQDSREFYGTDRIGGMYYAGLSYNF